MSRLTFVPFTETHIAGAARLLAERHAAHRLLEPLLPAVSDFGRQVANEFEDATGTAAIAGGDVAGYLIGKRREDEIGPHVWSGLAGHAAGDPELVRDGSGHDGPRARLGEGTGLLDDDNGLADVKPLGVEVLAAQRLPGGVPAPLPLSALSAGQTWVARASVSSVISSSRGVRADGALFGVTDISRLRRRWPEQDSVRSAVHLEQE